jgi:hypothetical protein
MLAEALEIWRKSYSTPVVEFEIIGLLKSHPFLI